MFLLSDEDVDWLVALRERELQAVLARCALPRGRVLEVGGGTGHQAAMLASRGADVRVIDVEASGGYAAHRVFPVTTYDGRRIPFSDGTFEVVFSSNVLAHVRDLDALERELHRVLRPGGRAIHVLPTPAWRLWTSLIHPAGLAKLAARQATRSLSPTRVMEEPIRASSSPPGRSRGATLARAVGAVTGWRALGERGNAVSELAFYLQPSWWRRHFESSGWTVVQEFPLGLFYTGHLLAGVHLGIGKRQQLARVAGSATICFELRDAR